MTLNVNIYNLDEQNAQNVKGLNPGVISIVDCRVSSSGRVNVVLNALYSIARSAAMFAVSQAAT